MASTNQVQVKIVEVCQVTPSLNSPASATELSFPLTFFDLMFLKVTPGERLFFYKLTEATPNYFNSVILPNLKHSLSHTLLHYLPLAGNLMWPAQSTKPIILYTPNDGVSLTIAESNADFHHLSGTEVREIAESHPYVPKLSLLTDSKVSLLAVQITLFSNQGICIGASVHHGALDAKNVATFIRAWAHVYKQVSENEKADLNSLPPELTPFLDRTIIQDPDGIDMVYLNSWSALSLPGLDTNHRSLKLFQQAITDPYNKVRAMVRVSREDVKNLRERVLSQIEKIQLDIETKPMHLSSFVLAYAYVFVCIVKAKELEGGGKVVLGLTADCRARLGIPENYFGCCVMPFFVHIDPDTVAQEDGYFSVVEKLSEIIVRLNEGVLDGAKEKFAEFMAIRPGTLMITITGSPLFQIYEADFGWGMPRKVETPSIDKTGSISMSENTDGRGGIEIGLVLLKHEMEIFNSLFVDGLKKPRLVKNSN